VSDAAENAAVASVLRDDDDDAWIGLREFIEDANFVWVDDTVYVQFINWLDPGIGPYGVISVGMNYGDGKWLGLDYLESKMTNYVVEFDCV
jgi:hypothetical protein